MQARLIATLDELDASRNAHYSELRSEKRAKEKLSEKLDRYLDEVKRAEAEKNEMREVVSLLVEKGTPLYPRGALEGICQNQDHRWPPACIFLEYYLTHSFASYFIELGATGLVWVGSL